VKTEEKSVAGAWGERCQERRRKQP
jgi:hypothetical protein